MPVTRNGTKRPREPLLQLRIDLNIRWVGQVGDNEGHASDCGVVRNTNSLIFRFNDTSDMWWVV